LQGCGGRKGAALNQVTADHKAGAVATCMLNKG
jgi:hypothetical protein